MNRCIISAIALFAITCFTGCRSFSNPAGVKTVVEDKATGHSLTRISWDASRRGTYVIKHPDGSIRIVSEPPPDVALETAIKFAVNVNQDGGGGSGDVNETAKIIERAMQVSYMRELLYRISEAYANGAIDEAGYLARLEAVNRNTALLIAISDADAEELEILADVGFFGDGPHGVNRRADEEK